MLQLQSRDRQVLRFLEEHRAITTQQAINIFFKKDISAYRRLNQLEEAGILESYMRSKNKVYKLAGETKELSEHDLLIYDFYSWIYSKGGEVLDFKKNPHYFKNALIPDGLFKFRLPYEGQTYTCYVLLEIDLNHYTEADKIMTLYPKLYREQILKEYCGLAEFPFVIIARATTGIRVQPKEIDIIYSDLKFTNLDRLLLSWKAGQSALITTTVPLRFTP